MIDVIIPAYNAHKTIERTLFSIAYQDIVNQVNVLIVNDGSEMDYKNYVDFFSNFMKIRELKLEKNCGPGLARKYGINNTKGKFIVFIDSDDVFADNFALKNMLEAIKNTKYDVVVTNFVEETNRRFELHEKDFVWLHGKIYKRDFLESNNITFNDSRENEDNGFNQLIFLSDAKIYFIPKKTYIWCNNVNSLTRKNNHEYELIGLKGYIYNMRWSLELANNRNYNSQKIAFLSYSVLVAIYHYYLKYQEILKISFDDIKVINSISIKNPITYDDKCNIIKNQLLDSLNDVNQNYILNPFITLEEFLKLLESGVMID